MFLSSCDECALIHAHFEYVLHVLYIVPEPPTLILQFQYKDHKIPVFFGRNPYYMVEPQLFGGLY